MAHELSENVSLANKINTTENEKIENSSTEILNTKTENEQKINQTSDSKTNNENNSTEILNEETSCFNPSVSDDIEDDLKKLKGDAIGNTLYSERFVLSTLLKLTKIENNLNGDFEEDLGSLWDMTIEEDVVKLLLEHKCLELFSGIIQQTENKRLTEILIGIIGNMCSLRQARDELCNNPNIISPIIDLISCTDTLTLIQLMRLFCAALVFENSGDELIWLQHFKNSENFVENYAFMLNNSINSTLLLNALEALNAICAKFAVLELQEDDDLRFCDLFVKPTLIMGVNEAFKLLTDINTKNSNIDNSDEDDVKNENKLYTTNPNSDSNCDTPTENLQKIMILYLDIHVHLSQYGQLSKKCYEAVLSDVMECIHQILSPLCQPICLLPLTYNEQGIIENINELFQAIGDPFDEICFAQMTAIWSIIDEDMNSTKQISNLKKSDSDNNFDCNEDKNLLDLNKDIHMTILEYVIRVGRNASEQQLKDSFHYHNMETNMKLLDALDTAGEDFEPDNQEFQNKIKLIFCTTHFETESINSVDSNDE